MNVFFLKLEKLLRKDSKIALSLVNRVLNLAIPFNRPHKFKILELTETHSKVHLPFIRANKNHLATVHACSMATIGEYAAGIVLIKNFSIAKNRLIMKDLKIEFFKQAKEELYGHSFLSKDEKERLELEFSNGENPVIEMVTQILNRKDEKIAEVVTTWQLKKWTKVQFK